MWSWLLDDGGKGFGESGIFDLLSPQIKVSSSLELHAILLDTAAEMGPKMDRAAVGFLCSTLCSDIIRRHFLLCSCAPSIARAAVLHLPATENSGTNRYGVETRVARGFVMGSTVAEPCLVSDGTALVEYNQAVSECWWLVLYTLLISADWEENTRLLAIQRAITNVWIIPSS